MKTKTLNLIKKWDAGCRDGSLRDDHNPQFLFQTASNEVLKEILESGVDLKELLLWELSNRGIKESKI